MQLEALQQRFLGSIMRHPLTIAIGTKQINRKQYRAFLQDVYSYAKHSPQIIALTAVRLFERAPELAKYCAEHSVEELGHDKWAASDLRDLGMTDAEIVKTQPSSACLRMLALEYYYAEHLNPVGMVGWMFVLESLGGNVGNGIASMIDSALGLEGKGTYFLGGHGEADVKHSSDMKELVGKYVTDPDDVAAFERMALEGEQLYCGILDHALAAA